MKNYKSLLLLLAISLGIISCEKENDITPIKNNSNEINGNVIKQSSNKSSTDLNSICQAANISNIDYTNGEYIVEFYDSTSINYSITINNFDDMVEIDFDIDDGSNIYNVLIDVSNETIDIEGDDEYTFDEFESYSINTTTNRKKNVTIALVLHHVMNPNASLSVSDNGTSDSFDPVTVGKAFWKNTTSKLGPCSNGLQTYVVQWERFWVFSGTDVIDLPC